ncbi:MAG: AI-2E family transporter [Dinoroseobacter sp.]|nr:AI-2E family transporter [Dinoroseobacter sp.]
MVGAIIVAALYFGRGLLVPFAIALLLFFLLTALIDRIAAAHIAGKPVPVWLAHVAGFGVILLGLVAILSILSSQAQEVAEAVPRYQARFADILAQIVAVIGDDNAQAVDTAIAEFDISSFATSTVNTAGSFLSGVFLVLLYIPFMMLERHPMKAKVAIAAPDPELGDEMSKAVRSISLGLQRYVGIKTLVSALTGLFSYVVMRLVGLDFAETWGVLAFALNFIPTIGSILGVVFPSIVALVQFETLTPFLIIALGCGAVQFVIGNVVEPSLTGKSLNLSPLMVILALTLWSTIWGISGAFLSVPLTVCAMIVLAHVPSARWAAVLMSGDGNLRPMEDDHPPPTESQDTSLGKSSSRTERRRAV